MGEGVGEGWERGMEDRGRLVNGRGTTEIDTGTRRDGLGIAPVPNMVGKDSWMKWRFGKSISLGGTLPGDHLPCQIW